MLNLRATGFLLAALCDQLGLCLSPEARRKVLDEAPPDAESFVAAVFAAEDLDAATSHRALYDDALALAERAFADNSSAGA